MGNSLKLIFGEKGKSFLGKILSFQSRFPHLLPQTALKESSCFLSHLNHSFMENHSMVQLVRIFLSLHDVLQKGELKASAFISKFLNYHLPFLALLLRSLLYLSLKSLMITTFLKGFRI